MARLTLLAVLAGLVREGAAICMDDDCSLNLDILISGGNATFTASCLSALPISWCAFGITSSGLMFPAGW